MDVNGDYNDGQEHHRLMDSRGSFAYRKPCFCKTEEWKDRWKDNNKG